MCECTECNCEKLTARDVLNILENKVEFGEAQYKSVIRAGKIVRILQCPPGFRRVIGRCVKMSPTEMKATKRRLRKANRTKKQSGSNRKAKVKRAQSLRQLGHIHR